MKLLERVLVYYRLFKGSTLDEELGFVRYFHNHPINVALHLLGFPLLLFALFLLLGYDPVAGLPMYAPLVVLWVLGFLMLDVTVGVCWAAVFAGLHHAVVTIHARAPEDVAEIALLAAIAGLVAQGVGHVRYDRSLPAFRLFEAFFTTPFYVMLAALFALGYRREWRTRLVAQTRLWRGSEKRIFGERHRLR
jgi:uncharacterized membrane protein YGL010W